MLSSAQVEKQKKNKICEDVGRRENGPGMGIPPSSQGPQCQHFTYTKPHHPPALSSDVSWPRSIFEATGDAEVPIFALPFFCCDLSGIMNILVMTSS